MSRWVRCSYGKRAGIVVAKVRHSFICTKEMEKKVFLFSFPWKKYFPREEILKHTRPAILQVLFATGNACILIEIHAFSELIDAYSKLVFSLHSTQKCDWRDISCQKRCFCQILFVILSLVTRLVVDALVSNTSVTSSEWWYMSCSNWWANGLLMKSPEANPNESWG